MKLAALLRHAVEALMALCMTALPAAAHVFQTSEAQVFFDRKGEKYGLKLILNLEAILAKSSLKPAVWEHLRGLRR